MVLSLVLGVDLNNKCLQFEEILR